MNLRRYCSNRKAKRYNFYSKKIGLPRAGQLKFMVQKKDILTDRLDSGRF